LILLNLDYKNFKIVMSSPMIMKKLKTQSVIHDKQSPKISLLH